MTTPTHTASAKATRPIRLVLVDDHRMFRSGVKAELDPAVTEVVGEAPDVDTLYLMASPQYSFLSSSGVKELAIFDGSIEDLVPEAVARRLKEELSR